MKLSNMSLFFTCFLVFFLSLNGYANAVKVFKVGDELGWQEPGGNLSAVAYAQWAQSNRFRVGDSLLFKYKNDSVLQVDKWGYYHCSTSKPIIAFNNGNSTFILDKPGPFYFICGALNHCLKGQRLIVEVMGDHSRPPSIAYPPGQAPMPHGPHPSSGTLVSGRVGSVYAVLVASLVALI